MKHARTAAAACLALLAAACAFPTDVAASGAGVASSPAAIRIEGPITGGKRGFPYSASIVDLARFGYTEQEYFMSGVAHPFVPAAGTTLAPDGRWNVVAGDNVPYKTRFLVRKPPADKFNGTVIVEFMQEYYGTERDTNYRWNAETILREGFGWVGISLHHEGIDDTKPPISMTIGGKTVLLGTTLARWDPDRYGSLSVPSSDLSYDILSQVAQAIRGRASGVAPFDGLSVRKVLAVGNTIAAQRLGIYVNGVQPVSRAFDGFYLQDFTPGDLQLSNGVPTPTGTLRTDTSAPVIVLDTNTAAAQIGPRPEGQRLRYWHPAGSSHTTGAYMARVAQANRRDLGEGDNFCPLEQANALPVQYVSGAALVALGRWANGGAAAPSFPQLSKFSGPKDPVPQPAEYFDAVGNVKGGLRTPWVDVPVARYDWRGPCPAGSGSTFAFSPAQLTSLYGTPANYRVRFAEAVRDAEKRGALLPQDAQTAIETANKFSW